MRENAKSAEILETKWCPGPELNRYVSFETRDFKSRASASFATRACGADIVPPMEDACGDTAVRTEACACRISRSVSPANPKGNTGCTVSKSGQHCP